MAMLPSDSSHHGVVENGSKEIRQGRQGEAGQLGPSWYFSRREIEENSPSRRDGIDVKKESYLRRSYCSFLQELGMKLKVPQVTIATAMVFCHRFYLRQSHAKNDRRTIATVCMFLAGKVEETPRPLKDIIQVSYEVMHKKDPTAGQRIKQQRDIYDKQKELILLGERIVLVTLGFDLNVHHAYKPLVEAIRKFNVGQNSLPQVAWNFVNDGLRTSLCLQFEPHHIAAGAIFLAAKFLKVKLPSDGDKIWWQDFDVTPRQLEEVSNQMLELYEQNRSPQAQPSEGHEAEGSSANVRNPRSSVKSEGNSKESSAHGCHQGFKQSNLKNFSSTGASDAKHTDSDKQISDHKVLRNGNDNNGRGRLHAGVDSLHHVKQESDLQETREGIPNFSEAASVSSSMMDAMNKIDKDKVKAALEKRRKSKGDVSVKPNVIDDDDLLERELEHGVELAVEDEKIKQEHGVESAVEDQKIKQEHGVELVVEDEKIKQEHGVELAVEDEKIKQDKVHHTCSGTMHQGDVHNSDQVENGHHDTHNVPVTAADVKFSVNSNEQHSPQLSKTTIADNGEFPINSIRQQHSQIPDQNSNTLLASEDVKFPVNSNEQHSQITDQNSNALLVSEDVKFPGNSNEQHSPQISKSTIAHNGEFPINSIRQHSQIARNDALPASEDAELAVNSNEQHSPQLPETTIADSGEFPINSLHQNSQIAEQNDALLAGKHEQDGRDYKRPKLEG